MINKTNKLIIEEALKALNSKPKQKVFREKFYLDEREESYNSTIQNILDTELLVGDTLYLSIGHESNGMGEGDDGETVVTFQKTTTGFILNLYEYSIHDFPEELEEEEGYDIDFFGYTEPSIKDAFNRWARAGKRAWTKVHCYNEGEESFSVKIPLIIIKDKKFNTSYDALKHLDLFSKDGIYDTCAVEAEINGKGIDLDDYNTLNESKNKHNIKEARSEKKYSAQELIDIVKDHSKCVIFVYYFRDAGEEIYFGYSEDYKNYVTVNTRHQKIYQQDDLNNSNLLEILNNAKEVRIDDVVELDNAVCDYTELSRDEAEEYLGSFGYAAGLKSRGDYEEDDLDEYDYIQELLDDLSYINYKNLDDLMSDVQDWRENKDDEDDDE